MNRESEDSIYNGPRYSSPLKTSPLGGIGTSTEAAFALGREYFRDGRSYGQLATIGKNKGKAWLASARKGYAWQKARSRK